ncbi:MAG: hypothetical protein H5T72_07310 [Actinobacteria bacterium]|nr:hypothetical protein [Actinomycetota bacterium]
MFLLSACLAAISILSTAGCGHESPEEVVYHFLGAVQAQDFNAMRSLVNPEARRKVESEEEGRREWEELRRRYLAQSPDWRFRFQCLELSSRPLDGEHALVTVVGGKCVLYRLKDDRWVKEGEIDFSRDEFVPLYLARRNGEWYLEVLDLYVLLALEKACRE